VFERLGCPPQDFFLVPSPQQQAVVGRLDDHRTLAHYADRLLQPAACASPAATAGRPSVQLLLRWKSKPRLFSLPRLPPDRMEKNGVCCGVSCCVSCVLCVSCVCRAGYRLCVSQIGTRTQKRVGTTVSG
jgi:hypothetical protein